MGSLDIDDHFVFANGAVLRTLAVVGPYVAGSRGVLFLCHMAFGSALLPWQRGTVERPGSGA